MSEDAKLSAELDKVVLTEKGLNRERLLSNEPLFEDEQNEITFRQYVGESDLNSIIHLISKDLSEPYSIYTYRYFIYNWPELCLLAVNKQKICVGAIVCKTEAYFDVKRGYIAMLAVEENHRRMGIGLRLVDLAIQLMFLDNCGEIALETEVTNKAALALYEKVGFCRDKRLFRYYLNGADAFRLKLWITSRMSSGSL
ncbi:N-alpha-acetyltransferase 30 isoform 2 [Schistosoma japonicum]|uniref:N-alpha-acetyltransferase 30 isoform 2 n=1 Tax=Schistosoma japonicum TaxID=6182 RepID=A0A4Z2D1X5_SCHJA|nr:N-alpha-acetyltransferase 30 isoform 2 [Schistosoma japonicum]